MRRKSNQSSIISAQTFALKDLGNLYYFFSIEVQQFTHDIFLSQAKYTKDLLCKARMQDCSPINTLIVV